MKEQLAKLIEAYSAARCSQNAMLLEFAVAQLQSFLNAVDIVETIKDEAPL
jgi:hypothetical protein